MKAKLFLGIIIIFALISGMLIIPIIEGACNYDDGGSIGTPSNLKYTEKCYGWIGAAAACKKDLGSDWDSTGKEKPCPTGGLDAIYQCKKKGGSDGSDGSLGVAGSPVTSRTSAACKEITIYDNEERVKQAEVKLNELKTIAAKTKAGVYNNARAGRQNMYNAYKMYSAVGEDKGGDSEEEKKASNELCNKYPSSCPTPAQPAPVINVSGRDLSKASPLA